MTEDLTKRSAANIQPKSYQIRIEGFLDPCWSEWLECAAITHTTSGETILSWARQDQAALHGLLEKIRDMNLKLVSVTRGDSVPPVGEGTHDHK